MSSGRCWRANVVEHDVLSLRRDGEDRCREPGKVINCVGLRELTERLAFVCSR